MAESFTDYEKLAFRHAPDATLILADRVILRASLRVESVFGWKLAELEGQSIRLLYPGQTDFEALCRELNCQPGDILVWDPDTAAEAEADDDDGRAVAAE